MTATKPAAIRHIQQAIAALDETRYRLSCAIVACTTDREVADELTTIHLALYTVLDRLLALIRTATHPPITPPTENL
jgi:hypothetical protein